MPFSLDTTLPPGPIPAGGPVPLRIALRNLSRAPAAITRSSPFADWDIAVRSRPDDRAVPHTDWGSRVIRGSRLGGSVTVGELASGAVYAREVPLHRVFDLSMEGRYVLSVSRSLTDPDSGAVVDVRAVPLEFELV